MDTSDDSGDWWFEQQRLRQEGAMDCGVSVVAELANLTREQILSDVPGAIDGLSASQIKNYLEGRNFEVTIYGQDQEPPLPCAHLVGRPPNCHWVYQAADGGIHDPSPVFQHCPPKSINLQTHYGGKILSIGIARTET